MVALSDGVKLWGGMTMETKNLSIPNITCGHCVMSIQRELGEIDGVSKTTLEEINYPAAD